MSSLDWWQDGDTIRSTWSFPTGFMNDYVVKGDTVKSVLSSAGRKRQIPRTGHLMPSAGDDRPQDTASIWTFSLFRLPYYKTRPPCYTMLDAPHFRAVTPAAVRGKRLYKVEFNIYAGYGGEMLIDPKLNFLNVYTCLIADGKKLSETEVVSTSEVKPGIYFPSVVQARKVSGPGAGEVTKYLFKDVRVNDPIDARVFDLKLPPEVWVSDRVRGVLYKVDADERRTTDEYPLPKPSNLDDQPMRFATGDPRNPSRWPAWGTAGIVGLGLALAAGIALVWARHRRRAVRH
jgi:hypothetical protein